LIKEHEIHTAGLVASEILADLEMDEKQETGKILEFFSLTLMTWRL